MNTVGLFVFPFVDCARCGQSFQKTSNRSLYCLDCRRALDNERTRAYGARHPERLRVARRKWREANPALNRAVGERWRLANMEKTRVYRRAAKKRNPDANRSHVRARTARLRGQSVVHFTPDQLRQRLSMFAGCWMCGGVADTIDHVKPISRGGAHMLSNLRPACRDCNTRKNDRWPLRVVA